MRGTDLTDWQLKAAEKFLRDRNKHQTSVTDEQHVTLPFGQLVRIVAWYGQIRAKAVEAGIPADEPGETYVEPRSTREDWQAALKWAENHKSWAVLTALTEDGFCPEVDYKKLMGGAGADVKPANG